MKPMIVTIEVFRQKGTFKKAGSNWDWRMVYRNGKIGGGSTEGYRNRIYALQNLAIVTGIDVRPLAIKAKPFRIKAELRFGPDRFVIQRRVILVEDSLEYING